jgi:small subunit ribosomal protein S6
MSSPCFQFVEAVLVQEENSLVNDLYELMYILRPDLNDEQVTGAVEKYKQLLEGNGATNIEIQQKGKKRLAYPIKKNRDGYYVQVNYTSSGQEVAVVERAMRLSEEVIRYLTIKQEPPAPVAAEAEA